MDGIAAVVPEHHEDIALDCGPSWRYLQVKSREPDLGLWTLAQLLKKARRTPVRDDVALLRAGVE